MFRNQTLCSTGELKAFINLQNRKTKSRHRRVIGLAYFVQTVGSKPQRSREGRVQQSVPPSSPAIIIGVNITCTDVVTGLSQIHLFLRLV